MQADEGILSVLFLSSLPFGLYANKENLLSIDRDFIVQNDLIPYIVPTQVDFVGYGAPVMVFSSRKGQIATLNLFEKSAPNYNLYVAATSGGGKSFFINKLVTDNYAMGAKVRIIDIGGSYKKQCKIFNGQYIDFSSRSDVCLNPFSNITKEEVIGDIVTISAIVMRMIFSATAVPTDSTSESIYSIISAAVKWAIDEKGNEASIDTVYEYLSNFSKYAIDFDCPDKSSCGEDFKKIAQVAAFNLQSFTSDGVYGKWFNGKATLDISKDDFVVLELEHLKSQKELFNVVTLQVVNIVTQDLYLGDRSKRGLIIFEEAWQFLTAEGMLAQVIEEGYRRARKYGGSFSIVTQSIMDLHLFGKVGTIINSNSAFKIFLESSDFEKAKMEKLIDYDDFTMELLKSLKSNIPKYSELFLHTPGGCGIVRLSVDPFSYYVYTSNPNEFAKIEELVNQGWTYDKAIEELISCE